MKTWKKTIGEGNGTVEVLDSPEERQLGTWENFSDIIELALAETNATERGSLGRYKPLFCQSSKSTGVDTGTS